MPQTSTGTPSGTINAQCTVPAANDFVTGAGLKTMADSIENDIASIKAGAVTLSNSKTFSADVTIQGPLEGFSADFSDVVLCDSTLDAIGRLTAHAGVFLPSISAPADGTVPLNTIAIYFDGTNLKTKRHDNTVKTITET